MKFASTSAVAFAALSASAALAQTLPAGISLNPALPSTCSESFLLSQILNNLSQPCALGEVLNVFLSQPNTFNSANSTLALVDQLVHSTTFLPGLCSDKCNAALATSSAALSTNCGTTVPLLANNASSPLPSQLSTVTAADLSALITYGRNVICTKNGNDFCATTLFDAFKASGMSTTTTDMSKEICTPCGNNVLKAANQTSGLPASISSYITSGIASDSQTLSTCSPAQLAGTSAAATTTAKSSATTQQSVGVLSAVAAFAASLVFA
ncbi:hypothetical protein HDU87_003904 [Geranomyces variabilis]|uniref:Uncharacterized protein n=1 Tax=Geranomyces variabilis TaxID=109894 RepID=A0AAD5TQT7_9FUNG|nr:hypothetical protein HDU87_003904 [Geranomyces variabilis]